MKKTTGKAKKGLVMLLCACMVSGTTPLPARAESFTDGFTAETENTNGDAGLFSAGEADTGVRVQSQEPAIVETETDAETNAPSQEPAPVETEGGSEADFSSQDQVEEVQKLIHALPDAKGITQENLE